MGLGEKLKDIYYVGEEKWYTFWDKIDSHVPIYKIIDPVDAIVPSFALFLILIFILLLFLGNMMFGVIGASQTQLNVQVIDNFGSPIEGANVTIAGMDKELTTNVFGLTESIMINYGQINVTATKGDKTATDLFYISDNATNTIQLTLPSSNFSFSQKSIMFRTQSGELATGELTLSFACSSGVTEGVPQDQTVFGGTTNVAQPDSCGTLTLTVSSPKYNTDTFTLSGASGNFVLTEKIAKTQVKAVVNLTYEGQNITDSVTVQAFSTGNNYIPIDTELTVNGQATFDLIEGDYTFKTAAEKGYKQASSTLVSLTKESGQRTVTIPLEKKYLGAVRATIKEGSKLLEGARVALARITASGSTQEIWSYDTNSTGEVNFDVSEEGPFTIIATKEGYCDKSITAQIGDSVILSLKKYDGTCGHKLNVKVLDSDGKPVQFAKVAIFSQTTDDLQKLSYSEKITDYNGVASWEPVRKTNDGETYKVFAFKSIYSGWSEAKELNATTSGEEFIVRLDIPLGLVKVIAKDLDGDALQFSEVQIFDEYNAGAVSGKRMIENLDGSIEFNIKADKQVYAVIKKDGYESFTTIPKQIIGNGTITFEAQLSRPPVEELVVKSLGFYKDGMRAQKVEANQEYDALFEITAPKNYEELGFFVRVGKDYTTKTEMDKIFIKNVYAGGQKTILTGGTYNKPKGYSTDEDYLNLEENKWAEIKWIEDGFVPGKIIVGVKVKIRQTALTEERIDLGYRAWGVMDGDYERDPFDNELNTSEHTSAKQALYALTKPDYITVGMETLCDTTDLEKSFCITSTYTDQDGFTHSFNDSFDALNNTPYSVSVNVMNNSLMGFDNAKMMLDNSEENILMNSYLLKTPRNETRQNAELNAYKTDWLDVSGFDKGLSIDLMDLNIVPQKTGSGSLLLRIREQNSLVFEKTFSVNISSDKKMTLTYMNDGKFQNEMPKVISGKLQIITIKARNASNNLEISDALVKVYDRFGTKIFTTTTNALGVAPIDIPASFPGEKLTIKVEKSEFETFVKEFSVEEDVVTIDPTELNFTVNPQTNKEDIQTVKLTNQTGLNLSIKSIVLIGKLKGVLNESKMESWFDQYIGKKILSQDYEEIEFKVISSDYVPSATDLEGKFQVTLTSEGKSWVQEVNAKIRVGLGKDVDNQSCLQITPSSWTAQTRGNMIELGVELKNNCTVDSKPVSLKNLGLTLNSTGSIAGDFTAIYKTAQVEIGSAYARVLKPTVAPGEKIPLTLRFVPLAGSSGNATGSIVLEAQNNTDSAPQKLTSEVKFDIIYENLQDCMSVGTGLVSIDEGSSGTFSIINSCKFASDIQLDLGDLQAAVSEKTFALKAGETKEIQIDAQKGQMPGAYNVLVYARQPGSSLELLDNVKVIVNPTNSCFTLTRYEYDVYDSEFNNFDGVDRGYLTNSCVQKSVSAHVNGLVPFDNWQSVLTSALIGGIAGGARSGKIAPDWISNLFASEPNTNLAVKTTKVKMEMQGNLGKEMTNLAKSNSEKQSLSKKLLNDSVTNYDDVINVATNAKKSMNSSDECAKRYTTKLDEVIKKANTQKADANVKIGSIAKEYDPINNDVEAFNSEKMMGLQVKFDEYNTSINKGQGLGVAGQDAETILRKENDKLIVDSRQLRKSLDEKQSAVKKKVDEALALSEKNKNALNAEIKTILKDYAADCLKKKKPEEVKRDLAALCASTTPKYFNKSIDIVVFNKNECSQKELENDTVNVGDEGHCCISGPSVDCMLAKQDGVSQPQILVKVTKKNSDNPCAGGVEINISSVHGDYACCGKPVIKLNTSDEKEVTTLKNNTLSSASEFVPSDSVLDGEGYISEEQYKEGLSTVGTGVLLTDTSPPEIDKDSSPLVKSEPVADLTFSKGEGRLFDAQGDELTPDKMSNGYSSMSVKHTSNDVTFCELATPIANFVCEVGPTVNCDSDFAKHIMEAIAKENLDKDKCCYYNPKDSRLVNNNVVMPLNCEKNTVYIVSESQKGFLGFTKSEQVGNQLLSVYTTQSEDPLNLITYPLSGVGSGNVSGNSPIESVSSPVNNVGNAQFLLAATASNTVSTQDSLGNGLSNVLTSSVVGMVGGSFLGGAVYSALLSLLQAQDTTIDYSETFFVPRVVITGFDLDSEEGITLNTFDNDQKIYEYSSCSGSTVSSSATTEVTSTATLDSSYAGTVLYDPQALNATIGYEELMELEFTNGGKKVNRSPNEPFVGVLSVTGQEAIYDTDYNYDYVKDAAENDGVDLSVKRSGVFGTILSYIGGSGITREKTAEITEDYLTVDEIKAYKKQFHLLFDSYEYVDCGPNTYPCTAKELSNCDIDGKNGYTGEEGIPKMKLAWNWNDVGINECDSDSNPDNYNYCDTTQFSIMLLKRMMDMKEFFNSTSLEDCPSSTEIAGTKTQDLAENDLDVGITSVTVKSQTTGALITAIVQTNNNLEMSAKMNFTVKDSDGEEITGVCPEQENTFKSSTEFTCELTKSVTGEGSFNVDLVMTPTLCSGCGNRSTGNDTIRTTVIIGNSGASQCLKYATSKDYFEKVLAANDQLGSANGNKILKYISFKANLLRDGFSSDFKADFDEFLNRVTSAPVEYNTGGFRELLLSDKFQVKWPEKPAAWAAGKYDATITVTFKNENWRWDNNNIESIVVNLAPQGPPEPQFAIYNVAFNGIVGLDSDNGRQGYGAGYEQLTEDLFLVTNNSGTKVYARPNASNNAATTVQVSTIKGVQAFNLLNTVPTRGNVLSISGEDVVQFVLTPSVAVPLIMNVTRNQSTDAYAFYSAEVNGQPQNTGGSFISWTGIGQGCVDFEGRSMMSYSNTYDTLASGSVTGFTGYGLPAWTMAQRSGTASFYGTFFAPQEDVTIFKLIGANESANFESTMGSGTLFSINTTNATDKIETLSDVLDLVKQEKICVVGGDYYWNNLGLSQELKSSIDAKENTCIPSRGN